MSTETDRELLEWAARAAGVELDYTIRPDGKCFYHSDRNALATSDGGWFAPLTDDGDALRLAVKLELDVCHTPHDPPKIGVWCEVVSDFIEEDRAPDPYAATRRAIVRAAAEIGKVMSCT